MTERIGLEAVLDDSDFQAGVRRYVSGIDTMSGKTLSGLSGASAQFTSFGGTVLRTAGYLGGAFVAAAGAAAAGLIAFTSSSISLAADLQSQMSGVQAILGGTEEDMANLNQLVLDLAINPNLKVSATEAAAALQSLAAAGLSADEIIAGAAESTVLLANATGGDFGQAAAIATDVMSIFGIEAENMIQAVNGIVSVTDASKFGIQDYAMALSQAGGAVAPLGVEFDDFNTSIAALAPSFSGGSDAGTSFKTMIQRLIPTSASAQEAMNALGLEFFDANGNMKDMATISADLNQALYGSMTVMTEVGGRTAAQNEELSRLQGMYENTVTSIQDYSTGVKGAGMSEEARAKKLADLNAQLAAMQGQMQPLLAIQGDLIESTRTLTEEERNRYLTDIFGSDAIRAALGLAEAGVVVYTDEAQAARELGVSLAEVNKVAEGGITQFEALQLQMAKTDALEAAAIRMDNLKGSMEVFSGVVEAVKLQVGNAFLPILQSTFEKASQFLADNQETIIGFFENVAKGIEIFTAALSDGSTPIEAFFKAIIGAGVSRETVANLADFAHTVIDVTTAVEDFITKYADELKGALIGIGIAAAAAAGIGILIPIIAALLSPIGLIIVAAGLLGAAIKSNFAGLGEAVSAIVGSVKDGTFTWAGAWEQMAAVAGNLWAMVEPHLITFGANLMAWFNAIDWAALVATAGELLGQGFTTLWNFILPHLTTLWTNLSTWFSTIDWMSLAMTAVNFIVSGFGQLATSMSTVAASILESLTTWITGMDWVAFGTTFMTTLGNGLVTAVAAIAGIIGTAAAAIYTYVSTYLTSQDWLTIGVNLYTAIINALSGFAEGVGGVLAGWAQAFFDWVAGVDWAGIGTSIITFIDTALNTFTTLVSTTLAAWYTTFTEWVSNVDWGQIGYDLMTFILEVLVEFPQQVQDTLQSWFEAFFQWGQESDWEGISDDLMEMIIGRLEQFMGLVKVTLSAWYNAFIEWVTTQDWKALATSIIDGLISGLVEGVASVAGAMSDIAEGAKQAWDDFWNSQSPSRTAAAQAGDVVAGYVEGFGERHSEMEEAGSELADAVTGGFLDGMSRSGPFIPPAVEEVIERATKGGAEIATIGGEEIGMNLGAAIIEVLHTGGAAAIEEAITAAIEEATEAGEVLTDQMIDDIRERMRLAGIGDLLSMGGAFGNLASGFGNRFTNQVLDPLEEQIEGHKSQLDIIKEAIGEMAGVAPDMVDAMMPEIHLRALLDNNRGLLGFIQAMNNEQAALNEATAEYAAEQERILELQRQQQDLQFLQQQLDLLSMIREAGLNPADILGGMELGLEASLPDLIDAMNAAVGAIIEQANQELQVASPSRVFREIGNQVMAGLQMGLEQATRLPMMAMDEAIKKLTGAATLPPIVSQRPTTPIVRVDGSQQNNAYNLSLNTRQTEIPLRRAFRVMELGGRV